MGVLLLFNGAFMLVSAIVGYFYDAVSVAVGIISAGLLTVFLGMILMFFTRDHKKEIQKREGYIVVTFGWMFMSLSGCFPYFFTGSIPSFKNPIF